MNKPSYNSVDHQHCLGRMNTPANDSFGNRLWASTVGRCTQLYRKLIVMEG